MKTPNGNTLFYLKFNLELAFIQFQILCNKGTLQQMYFSQFIKVHTYFSIKYILHYATNVHQDDMYRYAKVPTRECTIICLKILRRNKVSLYQDCPLAVSPLVQQYKSRTLLIKICFFKPIYRSRQTCCSTSFNRIHSRLVEFPTSKR